MTLPMQGYQGGGGSSGGGGGGGGSSSSTVSDAEFDAAIRQSEALNASGGGGVSYGNSGYIGSGGTSSDIGGTPAPQVYQDSSGAFHTSTAARDAANAQIEAQNYANSVVSDAYKAAGLDLPSDTSTWSDYSLSIGNDQGLFQDTFNATQNYATALEKVGADPTKAGIVEVGSIADKGFFDWAIGNITGNADSDVAKASAAGDYLPDLLTGSQFKIDNNTGALVRQTGSGDQALDISMYLDYTGLGEQYDAKDFENLWTDEVIAQYGDNSFGFTELAKDKATLEQAVSGAWLGEALDTLTFGLTDFTPEVQMMPNGMLGINDPLSFKGIAYNALDTVVNSLGAYMAGGFVGDLLYGATGEIPTALIGAKGTEQIVKFLEPLDNQVFLGVDGKTYLNTSIFGGEGKMVALEDAAANVQQATQIADTALSNDSGSGDSFNMSQSLQTGISSASRDTAATGTNWRDYYKLDFNAGDVIGSVVGDAFAVDPEVYKGIEFAKKIDSGTDIVDAAIQTYGDKIVDFLPEGYSQPTEAAIRIAAGEDRVSVLGDVYGQDLGLDSPLGKASVTSLNTYDQTGDTNKALVDGIVTYVEEGGDLPDFEVPDYIGSELGFNLPDIDFGGINFGDLPDINLPDMVDLDLNIGSIDFSGVPVPDLNIDLPDLPDLAMDIDLPSLDWSGVDVTLPEVNLPQLSGLGVDIGSLDWSGTNIGDLGNIDLSGLDMGDLEGFAKGTVSVGSLEPDADLMGRDPFQINVEEKDTPLSRKLLNAKLV